MIIKSVANTPIRISEFPGDLFLSIDLSQVEFGRTESLDIEKISLDFSMEDIPEWDSFKHIELIIAIEKEFKIKLEHTDTIEMVSIPIIKSKILKLLNDQ